MLKVTGLAVAMVIACLVLVSTVCAPVSAGKPGLTATTLSSPTPMHGNYGWSVATDGNYVVVGEEMATVGSLQSAGAVYVYSASSMTLIKTLTSPNVDSWGRFGRSVAVAGGHVVVGAITEISGGLLGAGNVYVYDIESDTYTTLSHPAQASGNYGWSVATDGIYVVVGSPYELSGTTGSAGHAYVYDITGTTPIATLSSPSSTFEGHFGLSVAINGGKVLIGAPDETVTTSEGVTEHAGHVYMYGVSGLTDSSSPALTLTSPRPEYYGNFGNSVSIYGRSILIGAPYEDVTINTVTTFDAGHAYVYTTSGRLAKDIVSPNLEANGNFGVAVAIGAKYMVVSAPYEDVTVVTTSGTTTYNSAGRAYAFTTSGRLSSTLVCPTVRDDGRFGINSVATGGTKIVIGAPYDDVVAAGGTVLGSGMTYVYT